MTAFTRNTFNAGFSQGLQGAFFDKVHSGEFSAAYARGYDLGRERLMQHFDRIKHLTEAHSVEDVIVLANEPTESNTDASATPDTAQP